MSLVARFQDLIAIWSVRLAFLPPLLTRFVVGVAFVGTGWGKLHGLDNLIDYFTQLHIPAPQLQAPFIAGLEFVGGIAILLGMGTRLFSALLACTMLVAIATAKLGDVHDVFDLVGLQELLYFALFVWLVVAGAGAVSVDRLLARRRAV